MRAWTATPPAAAWRSKQSGSTSLPRPPRPGNRGNSTIHGTYLLMMMYNIYRKQYKNSRSYIVGARNFDFCNFFCHIAAKL